MNDLSAQQSVWTHLDGLCLKAVTQHLSATDTLAVRLTCTSWAQATPLPRVSLSLSPDCTNSLDVVVQPCQRLSTLLHKAADVVPAATACTPQHGSWMAKPTGAFAGVRQLVLHIKHPAAHGVGVVASSSCSCCSTPTAATAATAALQPQAVAQLLAAAFPAATSLSISGQKSHCEFFANYLPSALDLDIKGTLNPCHALLSQLLGSPHLRSLAIHELSLSCEGTWPQQLAAALQGLPGLTRLQLHNCPVAELTRLPSLPQLQQLSVSGRFMEPCPRSYSVRAQPLLPTLPGLQQLRMFSLPIDLTAQEDEDLRWQQHQQQQQQSSSPDSFSNKAGRDAGGGGRSGGVVATDWRTVQLYLTRSIAQQCPNLQQLQSDMPSLGWSLLRQQLPQLQQPDEEAGIVDVSASSQQQQLMMLVERCSGQAACFGPAGGPAVVLGCCASGSSGAGALREQQRQHEVECR